MDIRKFAIVIINDWDVELDRFNLDYAEAPKNLGFEFEFTTLEMALTTVFTSAKEKKLATTLNINFLPPYAYARVNAFKSFVQKYLSYRMVFEYYDTQEVKRWEGKIQKLGQEELTEWGGLVCPIAFLPGTPKYIQKNNTIRIQRSSEGKSYPYKYPFTYGYQTIENNLIDNTYFDDIPLRVTLHGALSTESLQVSLQDTITNEVYSIVRFKDLSLSEGSSLIIDAVNSKVVIERLGTIQSVYDYLEKSSNLDSFLHARKNTISKLIFNPSLNDTGYLTASYRQYTL